MFGNQIDTLKLQLSYDTKLDNATIDALKAFQLNTVNSDTSDLANSKLRDIEASANTFFTSIANNFNMVGYNKDVLKDYVPAIVYTMYDGYYIYSPYKNTLDGDIVDSLDKNKGENTPTYSDKQEISGIKPYIYYSCRYKRGSSIDVVITYSLDNYITVQGTINGESCNRSGYLLDNIEENGKKYRGIEINTNDSVSEYVYDPEAKVIKNLPYIKINGVKYYKDNTGTWFSILNGKKYPQDKFNPSTNAAIEYYKDAMGFKQWIKGSDLKELRSSNAVDEKGNPITDFR